MNIDKNTLSTSFKNAFGYNPSAFYLAPGRLEIIGNHTDHNNGLALVASATLYIKAAVKPRNDNVININSEGSLFYDIKAEKSAPTEKEYSTTNALIRGVVNGFLRFGYKVGGFDAYCISEVPSGGGVSSSAAFECLVSAILNGLYNQNKVSRVEIAQISQIAEREYFGKPCGILDQIGCAHGGISYVDFKDPQHLLVKKIDFPFTDLKLILINPGGSHAGLTSYYASIPNDMHKVASLLGKANLREVSLEELNKYVAANPGKLSSRELNRARHYYLECQRVDKAYEALVNQDVDKFISLINESGNSSSKLLKNTSVPKRYNNSPERALKLARKVAPKSGHRVHGGGFMGTTISFVRNEEYPQLVSAIKNMFGEKSVIDVGISPMGSEEF